VIFKKNHKRIKVKSISLFSPLPFCIFLRIHLSLYFFFSLPAGPHLSPPSSTPARPDSSPCTVIGHPRLGHQTSASLSSTLVRRALHPSRIHPRAPARCATAGHRVRRLSGRACPASSLGSFLLRRPNYLTDTRAPPVIYHLSPPAPPVLALRLAAPLAQPARSLTSRSCSPLPGSRTPGSLPRHLSTLKSRPCTTPQLCTNVTLRALVRFAYTARPPSP
jgi:hypothetical protein